MLRSFRIDAPFGLRIRVQVLFVVLFSAISGFVLYEEGLAQGMQSVLLLSAAFLFVFLHEVGHAIAAKALGIKVLDITIWPLGGMARLEDVPKSGRIEFIIAAAGPLVNLVLAGVFFVCHWALVWGETAYTYYLLGWMNVLLAGFNLIPAFPLDGGRMLRAVLCGLMPFDRATTASVRVGQVIAIALGALALYHGMIVLALVAGFILIAARHADLDDEADDAVEAEETQAADPHVRSASIRPVLPGPDLPCEDPRLLAPRRWEFLRHEPAVEL